MPWNVYGNCGPVVGWLADCLAVWLPIFIQKNLSSLSVFSWIIGTHVWPYMLYVCILFAVQVCGIAIFVGIGSEIEKKTLFVFLLLFFIVGLFLGFEILFL